MRYYLGKHPQYHLTITLLAGQALLRNAAAASHHQSLVNAAPKPLTPNSPPPVAHGIGPSRVGSNAVLNLPKHLILGKKHDES